MEDIVLVGFGGHAASVLDSIERASLYNVVGYTDYKKKDGTLKYEYLGDDNSLDQIYDQGIRKAFVSLGQIGTDEIRHTLYNRLKIIGYELPSIIDPSAIISNTAVIEEGCFIGKGAIINRNTKIGKMSIINTGAVCEHDNQIGEFTHIAVRSVLCGNVHVGDNCFIGANTTVIQSVNIESGAVIGASSLVRHDVSKGRKVYGTV